MDPDALADTMLTECVELGQSARQVTDDVDATAVRRAIRAAARASGRRIRTARLGDTVVVARTDAALWTDDTATMRRKLTPLAH